MIEGALQQAQRNLEDYDATEYLLEELFPPPLLDPKVASAVKAWQGTAAGLIDTHPGLLAMVKSGQTDTADSARRRAERVADALLEDEPVPAQGAQKEQV